MSFAALETRLAAAVIARIGNIMLTNGVDVIPADLRRGVEFVGEFGLTGERRDRITVLKSTATAAGLAGGVTVSPDPAHYSVSERAAMKPASWVIDRKDADDGLMVSYWLK